jgi:predicted nucleic acid-binding protein
MTHYLDSSALAAWFDPANPHFRAVESWRQRQRSAVVPCYNRLLQVEISHYLRRLTHSHAGTAWHSFRAWEECDFYTWQKLDLPKVLSKSEGLSQDHKPKLQCGFWDLCHVAAARLAEVPFITCDRMQHEAAAVVGLPCTWLEVKSRGSE